MSRVNTVVMRTRRPRAATGGSSSAASDVYKGQVPRFARYRFANGADGFAMRVSSAVMEYYYTPFPAALSVQGVQMQNASGWTIEGWYYFSTAVSVYALMQVVEGTNSCSLQTNGG